MLKLGGDVLMSRLEGEMEAEFLCHGYNDRADSEDVEEWGNQSNCKGQHVQGLGKVRNFLRSGS